MDPYLAGGEAPTDQEHASGICICNKHVDGIVLNCQGANCRCHNRIHPGCFGMNDQDIQEALSATWLVFFILGLISQLHLSDVHSRRRDIDSYCGTEIWVAGNDLGSDKAGKEKED